MLYIPNSNLYHRLCEPFSKAMVEIATIPGDYILQAYSPKIYSAVEYLPARQTVSGFSEVSHISKISFVERTCWILVVDQKGHVWFCRFLETTDFCVHSVA